MSNLTKHAIVKERMLTDKSMVFDVLVFDWATDTYGVFAYAENENTAYEAADLINKAYQIAVGE